MKRSKPDYFNRVRIGALSTKALGLGLTSVVLSGCERAIDVDVITSRTSCLESTQLTVAECDAAYERALIESQRIGPKYEDRSLCESEFGRNQCQRNSLGSFTPVMAGYLFANSLWDRHNHLYQGAYNPVYRYLRPFSPLHQSLVTADGEYVSDRGNAKLSKPALMQKRPVYTTVSRNGFGKSSEEKSSWFGFQFGG